jgi:hypothetical protein
MATTPRNALIANGQALIGELAWPTGGGPKWHPYNLAQTREALHPQLTAVARAARAVPRVYSPRGEITARLTLHPTFLAKSHFPAHILRDAGLTVLGSRSTQVTPRVSQRGKQGPQDTAEILVAGTPEEFEAMDRQLGDPAIGMGRQEEFTHIESVLAYSGENKLRLDPETPWPDFVHVTLHANEHDADILTAFQTLAMQLGGEISARGFRFVPGLAFAAVQLPAAHVSELARFERIRLVRSMPRLREELDLTAALTRKFPTLGLPASRMTAPGPRVAVFDGGTQNAFGAHVVELAAPGLPPATVADLAHGVNVTSALLFGPVDPTLTALPAPPWVVEHHRVLPTNESPEQALDVLDRIVIALRVARTADRPYRFANISLGPVATFFDDDIHEWTSRLDTELADGRTLCTAAVGNNGALDGELGRIQPPGDAVNLFAVGAADTRRPKWNRAPYSATGPGRSPGFVKPDVLAFGGSTAEPLPVYSPLAGGVVAVGGTSFASPLALRTAVGLDVLSQSRVPARPQAGGRGLGPHSAGPGPDPVHAARRRACGVPRRHASGPPAKGIDPGAVRAAGWHPGAHWRDFLLSRAGRLRPRDQLHPGGSVGALLQGAGPEPAAVRQWHVQVRGRTAPRRHALGHGAEQRVHGRCGRAGRALFPHQLPSARRERGGEHGGRGADALCPDRHAAGARRGRSDDAHPGGISGPADPAGRGPGAGGRPALARSCGGPQGQPRRIPFAPTENPHHQEARVLGSEGDAHGVLGVARQ